MDMKITSALRPDDFRILIESIDEGICIIEKVETRQNERTDFRYVLTNTAFEKVSGLTDVIGKTIIEVLPGVNNSTMQVYDNTLATRQPARFETYEKALDRWFSAYAFPIGEPELKKVAVIFTDISAKKNAEIALRESEARKGYILKLSDALRSVADPVQIQLTACRVLGEHIGVSRVLYGEVIDEKTVAIHHDYVNGVPSIAAVLNAADFSQFTIDSYKSGKSVIINNVFADLRISQEEGHAYQSIQAAANISLGLVKNGKWVAVFGAHHNEPRNWTPLEISLLEETAERTWAAVVRARTEEALRESEKKYRTIIETSGEGIIMAKPQGDYLYVNQRFADMLGYPADELLEISSTELSYAPEHGQVMQARNELNKGEPLQGEFIFRRKDGAVLWTMYNATPVFSDDGEHLYNFVMHTDITERKQKERELIQTKERLAQTAEEKYRMLFNSIDQGFFLIDVLFDENDKPIDMYYVEANNAATKMLGMDFTGKRLRDINPNYEDYWFKIFGNVALTGQSVRLEQYAEPDKKWYSFNIFKTGDENSRRIGNIFLDITSRKHAEEALKESEQLYRTLFENTDDGFVLVEPIIDDLGHSDNYLMVNINQAWAKQTGLNPEVFIGKTIKESMPGVESSWPEAFAYVIKSGESNHFESFNQISKRWYDLYAFNYQEGLVGVLFHDISERKKIEEALSESEKRLRALTIASTNVVYGMSPDWRSMTELKGNGFLADTVEPNANWLDKYIHPDDHEYVTGVIHECIREKKMFELEHRVLQADGSIGWTYSRAIPMLDEKGEIKEWFGAASDITGRKKAEDAVRESERKFSLIYEKSPIPMVISRWEDGLMVTVNEQAEKTFGFTRDEMIGKKTSDLGISRDFDGREHMLAELHQKGSIHDVEMPLYTRSGEERIFFNNLDCIELDGTKYILSVFPDITERKRAEEEREKLLAEVSRERERLETIINSIDDEVWISDAAGNLVQLNPTARMVHGIKDDGKPISGFVDSLEILEPDGSFRLPENKPILRALKGEIVSGEECIRHLNADVLRFRRYNCAPIRDNLGNITGTVTVAKDITERKKMEEELVFHTHILSSIQDAICAVDEEFHITYWNEMAEKMFGWTAHEVIGVSSKDIFRMVSPINREEIIANLIKNNGYKGEAVYKKKDGTEIYTNVVCSVIRGTLGEYLGNVSTYRDITDRKLAEEALRESEAKFRQMAETISSMFWISEFDSIGRLRYIYMSPAFEHIFGIPIECIYDDPQAWTKLIHPDDKERFFSAQKSRAAGEYANAPDFRIVKPDGEIRWIKTSLFPIKNEDGKIIRYVGIADDITERKREEKHERFVQDLLNEMASMSPSKEILRRTCRALGEYLRVGNVHMADMDEKTDTARAYQGFTDQTVPPLEGEWPNVSSFWHPEMTAAFRKGMTVVVRNAQHHPWTIAEKYATTGVAAFVTVPFIEEGVWRHFISVISAEPRDWCEDEIRVAERVTRGVFPHLQRARAEEALQESEAKAMALVEELKIADKSKNQFISVLSHELRNPLAAISAGVQLLDITKDKNHTEKVKSVINRQMNQLCKLVDDLLELTRITQNKIKLKKEYIHLNETVKNTVDDFRIEYEKKGKQLRTKIQVKPVWLSADPIRVTQVIGNLLTNALKFTQENGEVFLSLKTEGNNAVIRVKDNGIGISPEILPRLFTPFTQADNSLDRSRGGLGLGLSIVKGIVDLHEGSVHAHSDGLGKGSTFTIRLPITMEGNSMTENPASDISGKKSLKLLIIEDNRDFADLLSTMLSTISYHVDIAYDGIEGIKLAKQIRPDVILCDIGLPGMNGYEVAKCVRSDESIHNIRLIALTGYASEGDAERILQAGFDMHLAKPVDFTTLKTVL